MGKRKGMKGSYVYAIKRGSKYMQGVKPNQFYSYGAAAPTMGNRHSYTEYESVWGEDPQWFERMTTSNYMKIIMEEYRWGELLAMDLKLIPKITGK